MAQKNTIQARKSLFLLVSLCLLLSCSGREETTTANRGAESSASSQEELQRQQQELQELQHQQAAIKSLVQSLDPVERYSQLFLVNLEGSRDFRPVERFQWGDLPERELIPGGYLFFSYNIASSPQEVAAFTASIQQWCRQRGILPPLLTLDQEGGDVNRLRGVTSPLPAAQSVAATMTAGQAHQLYALQAAQMRLLGFHLNLAPVVEAASQFNQHFLDTRSFGSLGTMEEFAVAAVEGFQSQRVGAVAKHFPGNTNDDPHSGLPEIALERQELERLYLDPFRTIISAAEPWAVLMSHARTAAHDAETPACLSRFWVMEVLRQDFGYGGLILSDDIFMAALEKNGFPPEKAVMMALEAGIDVIMLSEKRFGSVLRLILERVQSDSGFAALLDGAVERVVAAKVKAGLLAFPSAGMENVATAAEASNGMELAVSQQESWSQQDWEAAYRQGMELYRFCFEASNE